jgi:hypothetical protein
MTSKASKRSRGVADGWLHGGHAQTEGEDGGEQQRQPDTDDARSPSQPIEQLA